MRTTKMLLIDLAVCVPYERLELRVDRRVIIDDLAHCMDCCNARHSLSYSGLPVWIQAAFECRRHRIGVTGNIQLAYIVRANE
jgi:hypothetical protein